MAEEKILVLVIERKKERGVDLGRVELAGSNKLQSHGGGGSPVKLIGDWLSTSGKFSSIKPTTTNEIE